MPMIRVGRRARLNATFLVLALSLVASPAFAIRQPDADPSLSELALDPAPALPAAQETPIHLPALAAPRPLPGRPRNESDIARALPAFIRDNPETFGDFSPSELRLDHVQLVPSLAGPDMAYARFVQTASGLDVHGGAVTLAIKLLPGETRIMSVSGRLFHELKAARGRAATDHARASEGVRRRLGPKHQSRDLKDRGASLRWIKGRWRAVREFSVEELGVRAAVDESGEAFAWDERVFVNVTGNVSGRAVLFDPLATGANLNTLPLGESSVNLDGAAPSYADAAGNFALPNAGSTAIGLHSRLTGRWVTVNNMAGANLAFDGSATPGAPATVTFNPSGNTETNTSQVNAFYHTTKVRNWVAARLGGAAALPVSIPANVNLGQNCNAYYDYSSINFFISGNGCINTAFDTVIYHEYGHFVDDWAGGIVQTNEGRALSEGWGDILAAFVSGQPINGEGFFGDSRYIRTADNNYQYNALDEVHAGGQAWAGFAWHLRQNLIASSGQAAGAALAENLVIPVFWANSSSIPEAVQQVVIRDDNDGDLGNGTPHLSQIKDAAVRHGLGWAVDSTPPAGDVAKILAPAAEAYIGAAVAPTTIVPVAGTSKGSYVLEIGLGENPSAWTELGRGGAVASSVLGSFDTLNFLNGRYKLRLRVTLADGSSSAHSIMVGLHNSGIIYPYWGSEIGNYYFRPTETITGTVRRLNFKRYLLEIGAGASPTAWSLITTGYSQVSKGTLGALDTTPLSDGPHQIRLTVEDINGIKDYDTQPVVIKGNSFISSPKPLNSDLVAPIKPLPNTNIAVSGQVKLSPGYSFRLEWARGIEPAGGWSSAGVSLTGGGLSSLSGGLLGNWTIPLVPDADYYTLRLAIYDEKGAFFSAPSMTRVYLQPELITTAGWPRYLATDPVVYTNVGSLPAGIVPVQDAGGNVRLTVVSRAQHYTLAPDGVSLTQSPLAMDIPTIPAVGNVDGSAGEEIILMEGGSPKIVRPNAAPVALANPLYATFDLSPAVIADVDGDGVSEILGIGSVGSSSGEHLHIWRSNGQLFAVFKIADGLFSAVQHDRRIGNRLLALDTDKDGQPEILVAVAGSVAGTISLKLFSPLGAPKAGWSVPTLVGDAGTTGGMKFVQLAAADLDRDAYPEIIVSASNLGATNPSRIYVYSATGTVKASPLLFSSQYVEAAYVAVGDLNRDGGDELVAAAGGTVGAYRLANGVLAPFSSAWPRPGGTLESFGPPLLVDVTGDGLPEIVTAGCAGPFTNPWYHDDRFDPMDGWRGFYDTKLYALKSDASVAKSWKLFGQNGKQSSFLAMPLAGDFNRDGVLDLAAVYTLNNRPIIFGTFNIYHDNAVTVLSLGVPHNAKNLDWPMPLHSPRGDAQRLPPRVAVKLNGMSYAGNTASVALGSNLNFSWAAADADSCSSPAFGLPSLPVNGSTFRGGVQKTVYFDLECANAAGKSVQSFTAVVNGLPPALTVTTPAGGTYWGDNNNWWSNSNSMLWEKGSYTWAWQNTADIRSVTLELLKGQDLAGAALVDSIALSTSSSYAPPTSFSWKIDFARTFSGAARAAPLSGGWFWLRARTPKGDVIGVNKNGFAFYVSPDFMQPSTPGVPVVQAASLGAHGVSWAPAGDGESGVAYYKLERWIYPTTPNAVFIVTGTSFFDRHVPPGQYRYRATAVDNAGIWGFPSNVSSVITVSADATPPTTPHWSFMSPSAAAPNAAHSVYFATATDAGAGVEGYEISRSPDNGASWTVVASNVGNVTGSYYSYAAMGGLPAGKYLYRVRASDNAYPTNWGGYSTPIPFYAVTPPFLSAYTNGQSDLHLSWTAPTGTPDAISNHQVYIWGPFYDCPPNGSPVPYCYKFILSNSAARVMDFYNLRPNYNYYTMVQTQLYDALRGVTYWTPWSNMIWPLVNNSGTYATAALETAGVSAESLLTPAQRGALSRQRLSSLNRRLQPRSPLATADVSGALSGSGLVFSTRSASQDPNGAALPLPGEPLPHKSTAPLALTLNYNPEEIPAGLTASDLALFRWDDAAQRWEPAVGAEHDAASRNFTIASNEPGGFAILASGAADADEPLALGRVFSFPNPARGISPTIHAETGAADSAEIRIFNAADRLVHAARLGAPGLVAGKLAYEYRWEASGMPSGVYLFIVKASKGGETISSSVKKLALIK